MNEKLQAAFEYGVDVGIKIMMNKIQCQYKRGKPIKANGKLYWLTGSRQHLTDIMDGIKTEWNKGNQ